MPKLLSSFGERRARHAAGHEIDTFVISTVEEPKVALFPFNNLPVGPVEPQGLASLSIALDKSDVPKSCFFKTKGLSPSTGTQFKRRQFADHISMMPLVTRRRKRRSRIS